MSQAGPSLIYEPPAAHKIDCSYRQMGGRYPCNCSRVPYCPTCHKQVRHKYNTTDPKLSYYCMTTSKCQLCSGTYMCGETCDCSTPEGIVKRLQYKDLKIVVKPENSIGDKYLQVSGGPWRGRKWRLSRHMTKGEIVQTAFMACLAWEEHECREAFKYKGQPVMSPHYNIESLVRLCEQGQFEERT